MRKFTLLQMVQNILSALDSDEVLSISDTVESLQVAEILKETFYEQFNNILVPELRGLVRLTDVADLTRPNTLRVPTNVAKFEWIKYKDHRSGQFREVAYMEPEFFVTRGLQYASATTGVMQVSDISGITYFIRSDAPPMYFTLLDDDYIIFDSYDSVNETALQGINSVAYAWKSYDFPLTDSFTPPIDGSLFPLLLAEAKSTAFINLKQISSSKEEQRARRQRIRMQNDQFKSRKAQHGYHNSGASYARHR